jgi:hypothetical protein
LQGGAPPERCDANLFFSVYRFFDSQGTHDYVIRAPGVAPVVLRGVRVAGSVCELGMLEPSAGQTLRVKPTGLAEPDIVVVDVFWQDHHIPLGRRALYRAAPTAELRGIPSGTIRLEFFARGTSWTQEYDSNGTGTVTLPVSLPGG